MFSHRAFSVICVVLSMATASPFDRKSQQISLSSLLGDLENNILASALSFNKALTNREVSVRESKISKDAEYEEEKVGASIVTESTATTLPVGDKIIFQATEEVLHGNGAPSRIVVDRIAIQPRTEGALIPIFELKHNVSSKSDESDKGTVSKMSRTEVFDISSSHASTSFKTPVVNTSPTANELETATTPKNTDQLKEAEEELKEKFAEIEAEPVILSARV